MAGSGLDAPATHRLPPDPTGSAGIAVSGRGSCTVTFTYVSAVLLTLLGPGTVSGPGIIHTGVNVARFALLSMLIPNRQSLTVLGHSTLWRWGL
jgi:hypothetical protein